MGSLLGSAQEASEQTPLLLPSGEQENVKLGSLGSFPSLVVMDSYLICRWAVFNS